MKIPVLNQPTSALLSEEDLYCEYDSKGREITKLSFTCQHDGQVDQEESVWSNPLGADRVAYYRVCADCGEDLTGRH